MRAAVNQVRGWTKEPSDVIGDGCSPFSRPAHQPLYGRFDHAASQQRVGPWQPTGLAGNQSSKHVNERGAALKVFWIPVGTGVGHLASATTACHRGSGGRIKAMDKKDEPEGARTGSVPRPLLSVRNVGHAAWPLDARSRWVTERIVPASDGPPGVIWNQNN
jgi:hypothetical protein